MPGGGSPDAEKQHGIMPPQQLTFCGVLSVMLQLEDIGARVFFEKQLTSSDVSASGRVVVPKVSHFVTASNDVRSASAAAAYCTFVAWTRAQSAKSPCCLSTVPVLFVLCGCAGHCRAVPPPDRQSRGHGIGGGGCSRRQIHSALQVRDLVQRLLFVHVGRKGSRHPCNLRPPSGPTHVRGMFGSTAGRVWHAAEAWRWPAVLAAAVYVACLWATGAASASK